MAVISLIDYRRIADWWPMIYAAGIVLLLGVLTPLGSTVNGTKGWYRFGPVVLQPAELGKLATIIAVAAFLGSVDEVDLRRLAMALGPDRRARACSRCCSPTWARHWCSSSSASGMLVVAGVKMRHLAVLVLLGVVAVFGILSSDTLDQYQKDRLLVLRHPDSVSRRSATT